MKIVHIASGGPFTEGMAYQENMLALLGAQAGDDVVVVARPDKWNKEGRIVDADEGYSQLKEGYGVVRFPLTPRILKPIAKRLVKLKGLPGFLEEYRPDVIMLHGLGNLAMVDAVRYKIDHGCRLIADSHADELNASKNILVRLLLYRGFHRLIISKCLEHVDQVVVVSETCRNFLCKYYGIERESISIMPLGGVIPSESERACHRLEVRGKLGIPSDATVYIHTGKLTIGKRTEVILKAFESLGDRSAYLLIAGSADKEISDALRDYKNRNRRILFYGWAEPNDLVGLLQASDIYLQPGTASATLQQAICNGCAVIANLDDQYGDMFDDLVPHAETVDDFIREMSLLKNPSELERRKKHLQKYARQHLDYRRQVEWIDRSVE